MYLRIFLIQIFFATLSFGEVIEFSDKELAQESVLPVFETLSVVKNRNVVTEGKFEIGAAFGFNLTEALYNNTNYGVQFTYHFDETHAVNIFSFIIADGLSSMGSDLKSGKGLETGSFDASLAPHPESMHFLNYEFTAYYGKISLSKEVNLNLSLYGILGAGTISFGSVNNFGGNIGLGQKFFFSPHFAFRFDLRLMAYQGPDPTSVSNLSGSTKPDPSEFSDMTFYHTVLNTGVTWLF